MIEFHVKGMDCAHCVQAVTEAVHGVDPRAEVQVDLPTGTVKAQTTAERAALAQAIAAEGYEVVEG